MLINLLPVIILLIAANAITDSFANTLTVGTLSLWNLRYSWDVRKLRIAQMIREENPDVIAFQDVRGTSLDLPIQHSQIADLQKLLRSYPYDDFTPLNSVVYPKQSYLHHSWQMSGVGILSKHPIIRSSKQDLFIQVNTQEASRISAIMPKIHRVSLLYYHLGVAGVGTINVLVTQLSEDMREQCESVARIMKLINDERLHHVILLGNFNIHDKTHEEPAKVLTTFTLVNKSICYGHFKNIHRRDSNLFTDAWLSMFSRRNGYTFRDLTAFSKLSSRPDRIFVSQFAVQSVSLAGRDNVYAEKYSLHLYLNRFWSVIAVAKDSFDGFAGYPCLGDCGSGASCRCGVCVKGKKYCYAPNCDECSSTTFIYFCVALVSIVACIISFFHALLRGLLIVNTFHNYDFRDKLGFNCCLCHPELYTPDLSKYTRKLRVSYAAKLASCHLPTFQHVLISLLALITVLVVWRLVFSDMFDLVYSVPDMEWYTSDHLMVTATLLLHPANKDNIM